MRLLCCQKVCLLTQKQSFATIISDGSGAQNQIFCKQMFGKLKQIKSFIIIGKSLLTSPKPVNQVSGNQNHLQQLFLLIFLAKIDLGKTLKLQKPKQFSRHTQKSWRAAKESFSFKQCSGNWQKRAARQLPQQAKI